MAESFTELGLLPELAEAAAATDHSVPSPLQAAAIPVLRRGSNATLQASAGAGLTAAYGLALLDRLARSSSPADPAETTEAAGSEAGIPPAPRAVVLTPTQEATSAIAGSLARWAAGCGLRIRAYAPGWPMTNGEPDIVVVSPATALRAIQASALKLDAACALVVVEAGAIFQLGEEEALEVVATALPGDAQRVVTSGDFTRTVEDFAGRHARRALRIPTREKPEESSRTMHAVDYVVVNDATDAEPVPVTAIGDILSSMEEGATANIYCRTPQRAATLASLLTLRGFAPVTVQQQECLVRAGVETDRERSAISVSCDVPFHAKELARRHSHGGIVLVRQREIPHLRHMAGTVASELRLRPEAVARIPTDEVGSFRERLRRGLAEEDLGAQLLLLEPILRDFSAAEVAAAASALLRRRTPVPAPAPAPAPPPRKQSPQEPPPQTWARLFVSTGQRDGVRPGDIVGAITGEANVRGDTVGRIDIRDTFSVVEVLADKAQHVIDSLNGTTLKGRSLRVDYDRRTTSGSGGRRPR